MKKLLLIVITVFLFSVGAGAFQDDLNIAPEYREDIAVMEKLGLYGGYADGSIRPNNILSRAEFAKLMFLLSGEERIAISEESVFTDVPDDLWAKGYIDYCVKNGIVRGVGNGKFDPQGHLTTAQAAKMLLAILGYDAKEEGFCEVGWEERVEQRAQDIGLLACWNGSFSGKITREVAAKLICNAVFLQTKESKQNLAKSVFLLSEKIGLIVANERYAISRDMQGVFFPDIPRNQGEGYSLVQINGEIERIAYAVPDRLLGVMVKIYSDCDGEIVYITESEQAVVYNATAGDLKLNGESLEITNENNSIKLFSPKGRNEHGASIIDTMYFMDTLPVRKTTGLLAQPVYRGDVLEDTNAAKMIWDIGKNLPHRYRIISNDCGNTISYIFRLPEIIIDRMTGWEHNGWIDFELIGEHKKADLDFRAYGRYGAVLSYIENGRIVIESMEHVREIDKYSATTITAKNKIYRCNEHIFGSDFTKYVNGELEGETRGTFYLWNNYLMCVDKEHSQIRDAYLIVGSSYDEVLDQATVRLVCFDGREVVYTVEEKDQGKRRSYASDSKLGNFVIGSIRDGVIRIKQEIFTKKSISVSNNGIWSDGREIPSYDSQKVLAVVLGKQKNGKIKWDAKHGLDDLADCKSEPIALKTQDGGIKVWQVSNYIETCGYVRAVVLSQQEDSKVWSDSYHYGYETGRQWQYNFDTHAWFCEISMITQKGKQTIESVDTRRINTTGLQIGGQEQGYCSGCILKYKLNKEGKISAYSLHDGTMRKINTLKPSAGVYAVVITAYKNGELELYEAGTGIELKNGNLPEPIRIRLADKCQIIAIKNDQPFETRKIACWSSNEAIDKEEKNAYVVLQENGEIRYLFTLYK